MLKSSSHDSSYKDGITLADLQHLLPQQRKLVNWMRHQGDCSLLDIAVHLCQDEDTVRRLLYPLIDKGFILQIFTEDEPYYRVHLAPKRGRHLPPELTKES